MKFFKKPILLFVIIAIFSGCSSDDITPGCFQEDNRRILATITDIKGTVSQQCSESFVLIPNEMVDNNPIGSFFPCNLSDNFKIEGVKVIFSGYIYESFELEDICADFFEVTEIRLEDN